MNGYAAVFTALAIAATVHFRRAADHDKDGIISRCFHWATRDRFAVPNGIPKYARATGAAIGLAAVGAVAAFPFLDEVLATWIANPWGLGVLAIADLFIAGAIWWEWWHRHGYHPAWTNVSCALGGILGVVTFASWHKMIHQGGKLLPKTLAGIGRSATQIGHGHITRAQAANVFTHGPLPWILFIIVIGLVAYAGFGAHRWESRRGGRRRSTRAAPARATARTAAVAGDTAAPARKAAPAATTRRAIPKGGTTPRATRS